VNTISRRQWRQLLKDPRRPSVFRRRTDRSTGENQQVDVVCTPARNAAPAARGHAWTTASREEPVGSGPP